MDKSSPLYFDVPVENISPWPEKNADRDMVDFDIDLLNHKGGGLVGNHMPHIIVWDGSFNGAAVEQYWALPKLGRFNDKISSIAVLCGTWMFFEHINYQGASWTFHPGFYHVQFDANGVDFKNNTISSFKPVSAS